ncbi:hypothetical protein QAD02_006135 [Eretmocerus hayati]|uniref:Uncharacterized protein n=1 Tax=Eretmocerus hayati TaxID=131215 RepID=A0ACC2N149_9HYME|nr:hypothetical protein QAD02_006135 [Eretmocerus hayati]
MARHRLYPVLAAILTSLITTTLCHEPFIVQFEWNYINYTWPSEEAYTKAEKDGGYIERNNVISGIKHWKGRMYLTIPRWRDGVPVTLASTPSHPVDGITAPKLEPYPNWDMQKLDDCSALQNVQGIEIDPKGRLWVLDSGRTNILALEARTTCPPRLVLLDLEDNGAVLRSYSFPPDVVHPESAYLRDLVIDHEDGGFAYISDADEKHPGVIVVSVENSTSWKVSHESMRGKDGDVTFVIEQTRNTRKNHIYGLALSPASAEGERMLYYCPMSSFAMFTLPTSALKDEVIRSDVRSYVKVLGRKPSQTDGMIMSNSGILYFGLLGDDAVSMYNSTPVNGRQPSFMTGQRIISRDHHHMQWPTSFAFDEHKQLWAITNRLHRFLDNTLNIEEPNFRAVMSKVNMTSYQYLENGTAPEIPNIEAGAASTSITLATLLIVLMAILAQ